MPIGFNAKYKAVHYINLYMLHFNAHVYGFNVMLRSKSYLCSVSLLRLRSHCGQKWHKSDPSLF